MHISESMPHSIVRMRLSCSLLGARSSASVSKHMCYPYPQSTKLKLINQSKLRSCCNSKSLVCYIWVSISIGRTQLTSSVIRNSFNDISQKVQVCNAFFCEDITMQFSNFHYHLK